MSIIRASKDDIKELIQLIKNRFGNVDNTADSVKNVLSAEKLTEARTISLAGDANGSISFDGTQNKTMDVTINNATTSTHGLMSASDKSKLDGIENELMNKVYGLGVPIPTNSNLNDYITPGVYCSELAAISATLENTPWTEAGFRLEVKNSIITSGIWQIAYKSSEPKTAARTYLNGNWSSWITLDYEIKNYNLSNSFDMQFIDTSYNYFCDVKKSGNVVTINMYCSVKSLTGYDIIIPAGSIPEEFRPIRDLTFCISARDEGSWANADYVPAQIRIWADGGIYLATGTAKDNAVLINGAFTYIAP